MGVRGPLSDRAPLAHEFSIDATPGDLRELARRVPSRIVEIGGRRYRAWSADEVVDRETSSYEGPAGSVPPASQDVISDNDGRRLRYGKVDRNRRELLIPGDEVNSGR